MGREEVRGELKLGDGIWLKAGLKAGLKVGLCSSEVQYVFKFPHVARCHHG